MIIEAFLSWSETAVASDRARAAKALCTAFFRLSDTDPQRQAALHAMIHLLDDPAPSVRMALAETLAECDFAPRGIVLALAEDQPDVACPVLTMSPVLSEMDLVDLVGRGTGVTRAIIASRPDLSRGVAAAIAEVGDAGEVMLLLENETADITRYSLRRIAERHGQNAEIRNLLLCREDLPPEVRDLLVHKVSQALAGSWLVQSTLSAPRIAHITREAGTLAALAVASQAGAEEMPYLVAQMREDGRLTPAFLMHALCSGRIEFFAAAIMDLSGVDERRVRSILATGRHYAARALYESCGLSRDIAEVFVAATMLWRERLQDATAWAQSSICRELIERYPRTVDDYSPVNELLDMVETMQRQEERDLARYMVEEAAIAA
ncbi:DUF2336 domain-containing protein [Rhizobium helianthi]|uniref:DUF2336 domain-containing protein n=1 Tax=Rhizobium helianthi TaxID=1132695 RepID=A0ABW4LZK8_9HYPH